MRRDVAPVRGNDEGRPPARLAGATSAVASHTHARARARGAGGMRTLLDADADAPMLKPQAVL